MHILGHWAQHSLPLRMEGRVEAWWYRWLLCPKLLEDDVGDTWPGRAEEDWNAVTLWRTKLWWCFLNSPLFLQWQLHSLIYHRESHSLWHGLVTKRTFRRKASFTKGLGESHLHSRVSEAKMKLPVTSKSYFTCLLILEILPKEISF